MAASLNVNLNLNSLLNLSQSPAFSADNFKKHTKKLLRSYALEAQRSYVRAFSKERDPITDKPWAERSPAYVAHLTRIGKGSSKLLQVSLNLRNRHQIFFNENSAGVGVKLVYAGIHQFGGEAGPKKRRVKIPARPYLGLDQDGRSKILQLTVDMLKSAIHDAMDQSLKALKPL